jgi:16S rRNA A1518/A1519 N6-dimethyltransferase RsmA/KsgA/DIM1 with predicted DNA glycosylase/AP lyase activity
MRIDPEMRACDVGAGTGRLTLPLLDHGLRVVAVEPNAAPP